MQSKSRFLNSKPMVRRLVLLMSMALLASYHNSVSAAVCNGNCGTSGADGVVSLPPSGALTYDWVSTNLGISGVGALPGYTSGTTNGSVLTSDAFYASAGDIVEFNFNYITSDGSGYADYAWAKLQSNTNEAVIFTARTKATGNIVPGQELPGVNADLSPSNVPIIPGAPVWSPLGGSSNTCYSSGCGYTGWVRSTYTVTEAGTYSLAFGVVNYSDISYDSGLAFQGLTLNGNTIGNGSSADNALLPTEIGADGSFNFTFTPTPNQPVFIDPVIAIGYDYEITAGSNLFTSVILPLLPLDSDGYDIYMLGDTSPTGYLGSVLGGVAFNFTTALSGFTVLDIDTATMLDPLNTTAFVTGLTFVDTSVVLMSQTAITTYVPSAVPEPENYAMLIAGLMLMGFVRRGSV